MYSTGASNVTITGSRPNTGGTTTPNYYKTAPNAWSYLDGKWGEPPITTTLTAPVVSGFTFDGWTGECISIDNVARTCDISLVNDVYPRTFNDPDPIQARTVTANYVFLPPEFNTLQVRSTLNENPVTGVVITRLLGTGGTGGTTDYDFVSSNDISTWLSAPPTFDGANFPSWTGCDDAGGTACRADLSGNVTQTITVNYTSSGCVNTLPAAASGPSPADGATNVAVTTNLGWTFGAWGTFCPGNGNGYHVYISDTYSDPLAGPIVQGLPPDGSTGAYDPFTPFDPNQDLNPYTTYYWRITQCNEGGSWRCTDGQIWSFTTAGPPDLNDLQPRVYHMDGFQVSPGYPATPNEALRGQIRFYESENKPSFQFNAHWWSNTGAIAEGSCNTSGIRESGIWTNGINTTTYDVYFDAPGSPGTYEFWEYLDADCNIAEVSEVNNAEGVSYEVVLPPIPGDVSITSCSITPSTLNIGDDLTISATIANGRATTITTQSPYSGFVYSEGQTYGGLGFGDIGGRFRMGADLAGLGDYPYRWGWGTSGNPNATLNPGQSTTITGKITMTAAGAKTFQVALVEEGIAWLQQNQCQTTVTVDSAPSLPDLNDLEPRVYHLDNNSLGNWKDMAVSSSQPAVPDELLEGRIRFTESTGKPPFQFNARWWEDIASVTESTCDNSGTLASGIFTNGNNATEYIVSFRAPATAGTYNFYEYLDADCSIAEENEANNVEGVEYYVEAAGGLPDFDADDLGSRIQFYTDGTYSAVRPSSVFDPSEVMYVEVTLVNTGGEQSTPFDLGFWRETGSPSCVPPGVAPNENTLVASLPAGMTTTWRFTHNAPSTSDTYIASSFADYSCTVVEADENNNIDTKTYSVGGNNWLQAIGGDVGAVNEIKMSNPGGSQTDYLLIANSINGGAYSDRWKISGYNQPLVPTGGVYNYFNNRFGVKARSGGVNCNFASTMNGYYYCDSTLNTNGLTMPSSGSAVVFVDGDLFVGGDINLNSASVVFVVRDNMYVSDFAVITNRIDGVYIVGKGFADCTINCNTLTAPLTVNGAVYADHFFSINGTPKSRFLPSIGATTPSLLVNYQPRYLIDMNDLLGSPSIVWREVAP